MNKSLDYILKYTLKYNPDYFLEVKMSPLVLEKPVFTKDQVVSATEASKSLSTIRKRAKRA
ncbi:MAG: hypothetical protein MSC42_02395, partial [Collinsella sp.]|nr:hypothetical protein [Collinsella sp.]